MYLIEILHQTTTRSSGGNVDRRLYLIEILHQTTTRGGAVEIFASCILSKFYIKPQPFLLSACQTNCCILSKFYIKPQRWRSFSVIFQCCILSKFYIKPQLWTCSSCEWYVVSYRNSTSNHNRSWSIKRMRSVVSYRNSTSNHNVRRCVIKIDKLYLIEILHQTTTGGWTKWIASCCILSKFYIKPQRPTGHGRELYGCILSKFYIKPQRVERFTFDGVVVSYRNSTSNHNKSGPISIDFKLYLIEILHQTTTSPTRTYVLPCCILSKFYIKPQLHHRFPPFCFVVSYRNSTSNHNVGPHIDW